MPIVYVARHGETTWNLTGRYQGRLESPLSPLGVQQGRALAHYFASLARPPKRIFSSPLQRCTQTAFFAAELLSVGVTADQRLIEIAHGSWEGRYRDELAKNDAERYWSWRNDPQHVAFERGETLAAVRARWCDFVATLMAEQLDALVVTHDAVCRVALLEAMGHSLDRFWNVRIENGAFARLLMTLDGMTVLEECHTAHLAALRARLENQAL